MSVGQSLLLADPPPVVPDLDSILDSFLLRPDLLPIHAEDGRSVRFWERTARPERLLHADLTPVNTTLKVERDMATGQVLGFKEVRKLDAGTTAKNSSSLLRTPGPPTESTKGSAMNYPFWPGGFDEPEIDEFAVVVSTGEDVLDELLEGEGSYLTCPPGFARGVDFSRVDGERSSKENKVAAATAAAGTVVNLAEMFAADEGDSLGLWSNEERRQTSSSSDKKKDLSVSSSKAHDSGETSDNFDPEDTGVPVLNITSTAAAQGPTSTDWAELVDISQPMTDFHLKVPQMAFTWPFELDTFQKQAVMRLEQNESVFVAAHTSAGKTVVAEYAIALSQKHMTRTIYTSPIKALSNQKFRDFKDTFNDVGLVTGDIQINPTATCLIMTTEILRSMLYNGSDIIRDLEYVVFDEVHYINDRERGVVWEEVLILLPDHVNIIMLSATVPNTLEFADWVGRTKRKRIYVISTLKRPVPLEHFLYTGSNAKTRDERFLIQDAAGNFLQSGYKKAAVVMKERETKSKAKQQYGPKGIKDRVGPQQEKNIWLTLVDHLDRHDKLPVVAFTLSRNRCDQNAELLTSLDLTTNMEKGDIHHFIQKCVQRLKGSDRKLPQVLKLTDLLKRGIGIHHSGILPILKEVVEMLFQKGWVKLLFATETFAMGVNMPARTVVFDNIRKHDGTQFRTLKPAEYIQMAGRAGRRGLDSTGTVIILCKSNEIHDMTELHGMMQGKPQMLESQFRLTYSMILNLLRVEKLRVEDMMKRSFREVNSQKMAASVKEQLEEARRQVREQLPRGAATNEQLEIFHSLASDYLETKDKHWTLVLSHPAAVKLMGPGRVLVVRHGTEQLSQFGVLLAVDAKSREKSYSVLVVSIDGGSGGLSSSATFELEGDFLRYLALGSRPSQFFGGTASHVLIQIEDRDILEITTRSVKLEAEKIVADVKKREIPRFKNDPLGQSTSFAVQELVKVIDQAGGQQQGSGGVEFVSLVKDLKIQDIDLQTALRKMESLRETIESLECHAVPDFAEQLHQVHLRMSLEKKVKDLEFLASEDSLVHLPDYHRSIEVLKRLSYIDDNNTVKLKGRVACEMGSQELIITELVLDNVLTDLPTAEIAALLSCMVFDQRKCSEPELTARLQEGVKKIKDCAEMIGLCQKDCGMDQTVQNYVEQFSVGLVEVVYEWARGMPFAEITQLTDVQEGVIVRTIQRLDETIRDVKDAARVIGDSMLYQKMDETSTIIKRDIVFAASLYTQ